jgi:aspartyl aminopeptidase
MADAQGLVDFIHQSPTPFHCVGLAAERLSAAGFNEMDPAATPAPMGPGSGGYFVRGGTLIGWRIGEKSPAIAGFRLLGAHTDSPNLRLKPNAQYAKEGYLQWGVEPYGGVLLSTWADRDLGLSGRVALNRNGNLELELVRIDQPIARIPNLAIHLNRKVNDDGLVLNKQNHLPPILAMEDSTPDTLRNLLSKELGCAENEVLSWDLMLHDVQSPTLGGLTNEFIFAPRLDNQGSCYTALEALTNLKQSIDATAVIVLFDHEECGSGSDIGAGSVILRDHLSQLVGNHTESAPGGVERAAANSLMLSADMAHGIHPNYADKHDSNHKPLMNGGPVIKSNVNQRYATDAQSAALFKQACQSVDVPFQEFINRSDLACGTTIGPISSAQVGIRTVDVGCAMLSMHSIREQAGAKDVAWMAAAMESYLRI